MQNCDCKPIMAEEILSIESPHRNRCCEVEYQGKLREFALQEKMLQQQLECGMKLARANECCCKLNSN